MMAKIGNTTGRQNARSNHMSILKPLSRLRIREAAHEKSPATHRKPDNCAITIAQLGRKVL
jgi:hypothetical protein